MAAQKIIEKYKCCDCPTSPIIFPHGEFNDEYQLVKWHIPLDVFWNNPEKVKIVIEC